jgi:methionine-rich copper-binding protein CopC
MSLPVRRRRWLGGLLLAGLLLVVPTAAVVAHSDLKSSAPVEGATVPAPFSGPVVLTFTEPLADGSKADLVGPGGSTVATATVDGPAATMTFRPASALEPGTYQAEWTSIADDGDLLRGIVRFTVAAVATTAPQASPAGNTSESGSDVLLPIVIVLIVVAAGGFYLVRRTRAP